MAECGSRARRAAGTAGTETDSREPRAGDARAPRRRFHVVTPTIEDFGRRLRSGDTTSAETTEACLRRIDADDTRLNAFIHVMADQARRDAETADRDLAA